MTVQLRLPESRGFWVAVLFVVVSLTIFIALYYAFYLAPSERVMGAVQRVFYFHVGAAMACYLMVFILFLGSLAYLATRRAFWDDLAHAAALGALLMATIVLGTGMIWGHAAWNTWWRWEPRLVSFLALWLILFSYSVLRLFTERDDRQAMYCAGVGLLSALIVPLVVFSIKLLDHREQLHPQILSRGGLTESGYFWGLLWGVLAMVGLSLLLLVIKLRQAELSRRVLELEQRLASD